MNILVTGGAGFIGSHLVDALIRRGDRVRVLDSIDPLIHSENYPPYFNPKAEYVMRDLRDITILESVLKGSEVIIHLSALMGIGQSMQEAVRYIEYNTLATAILMQQLTRPDHKKLRKLIVASSMAVYGEGAYQCRVHGPVFPSARNQDQLQKRKWEALCPICGKEIESIPTSENKPLEPLSVYAISKRDQEELCLTIARTHGIPAVALRFFNVYGPRQRVNSSYAGFCSMVATSLNQGTPLLLNEDGLQKRDFIHVLDVIEAILLVLDHPQAVDVALNVGRGEGVTLHAFVAAMAKAYQQNIQVNTTGQYREGDIRHCISDITRIRNMGFCPKISLQQGLQDLVHYSQTMVIPH